MTTVEINDELIETLADLIADRIQPKMTLTTNEVARHLNCNRNYVDQLRRSKRIKGIRKGNGYIYSVKEIERFIERESR